MIIKIKNTMFQIYMNSVGTPNHKNLANHDAIGVGATSSTNV